MTQKVDIVGAGLVGPLMAIYLARKKFKVALHERRADMRKTKMSAGRSINLALTARGIKALDEVGLRDAVMKIAIPMRGRMIHDVQGNTSLQPYGQTADEVIYAVSRGELNKMLLSAAEEYKGVEIAFNRRCAHYDINKGALTFTNEKGTGKKTVKAKTVIGADGAWSAVRKAMLNGVENFNYSQSFLNYGYKELEIPFKLRQKGAFRMEPHALHIWPRHSYMMIALPNTEGSFTVTLFYPNKGPNSFEQLKDKKAVAEFFQKNFPDAVPHMPGLERDFLSNPTGALVTVKCSPWHAKGRAVLIGDAAHAIVPFFAQGMNSGFEDCLTLNSLIPAGKPDWEEVFANFEKARKPNADAIADMAVENFFEMRDSVTDPRFILRKMVGFELEKRWPGRFIPRYSMVIFHPEIPYAEAQRRGKLQDRILDQLCANISRPEQVDWNKAEMLIQQMA
jgi:kynurenine 3-monooxygenase